MTQFAEEVNEKTDGRIQVKIFPNGQLGSENENLEQLQAGVIAMTKVSAPGLATYNEAYNAFGLPYIFNDTEDFYHVMDSQQMQDFFLSTGDDGFVTLTYHLYENCRQDYLSAEKLYDTILFVMLSRSIIYHILKTVFKLRTFFA